MRTVRLAILAACLAVAFWLPATATAADPIVVAGVVTDAGGVQAAGVEVVVVVTGPHRSNPTPPATDRASEGDGATPAGRPFLAVAGLAFVLAGIAMVVAWRSRSAGR